MGGWNGVNDAWGDSTNLSTKYGLVPGFMPYPDGKSMKFGDGINQVFASVVSSVTSELSNEKMNYLRTCSGLPLISGESEFGTNQYGQNYIYHYTRANQFPLGSGTWNKGATAGIWCRHWGGNRSTDNVSCGFRVSAYL